MPSNVSHLLSSVGLKVNGQVNWGHDINENRPGVYLVSISSNPDENRSQFKRAPIDEEVLAKWIAKVPTLKVDGKETLPNILRERLSSFWLPDENVVYIGKAGTSIKKRVKQYYQTDLGEPRPHAGGHWLKTLSILSELTVYWAVTGKPEDIEGMLIAEFIRNVSESTKHLLFDPERPFPFANLEYPKGTRKRHGITGARLRR